MYKLTINQLGISFHQYDYRRKQYTNLIQDIPHNKLPNGTNQPNVELLREYLNQSNVFVRPGELEIAINECIDKQHNVAEFGTNGYLTITDYDNNEDRRFRQ